MQDTAQKHMEQNTSTPWERKFLSDYLATIQTEQRRGRRWALVLRMMRTVGFLIMATAVLLMALRTDLKPWESSGVRKPHTAVISLKGEISANGPANADVLIPALRSAFENEFAQAVILKINSPGGSAVQAGRIYDEIKALRSQFPNKNIYSVIDDFGASGGYYVAMAADQVFANRASLVGSIGVISSSFGFTDLMERLGIERRTFTAGQHKNLMDPFSPVSPDAAQFWQALLAKTHTQFIERVRLSRGDRLVEGEDVFSGLIWNGEQALEMGLIDGLESAESVARTIIGQDSLVNYTPNADVFSRLASRVMFSAVNLLESLSY